jgi:hypothetical protein
LDLDISDHGKHDLRFLIFLFRNYAEYSGDTTVCQPAQTKKNTPPKRGVFLRSSETDYFLFAMVLLAGFIVLLVAMFEGFIFELPVAVFIAGLAAGATVVTGEAAGATLVGLLVVLFAASPQAMPSAPKPRTVESKITFFMSLQTPVFLKD